MIGAFQRKLREGAVRPSAYAALLGQVYAQIESGASRWLSQEEEVFSPIREVYQKLPASAFLCAADAIHLATAAESGIRIVDSNDAHLLADAQHFAIQGKNIIRHPGKEHHSPSRERTSLAKPHESHCLFSVSFGTGIDGKASLQKCA
jgi:hypothetical protein